MKDWRLPREVMWADQRSLYTNSKHYLMNLFNIPRTDVPELITDADDGYARDKLIEDHPSFKFVEGYGPNEGSTLLKNKLP
ncbi:jg24397, partial [Pararge aegeria aegeria]